MCFTINKESFNICCNCYCYCVNAEAMKMDEDSEKLDARSFLVNPTLLCHFYTNVRLTGMTVLNSELFVVQGRSPQVNVYNTDTYTHSRDITITGSTGLNAIVASPRSNCLYVSEAALQVIYQYDHSNDVINMWFVNGKCYGLSLTSTDNVLVTLSDTKQIQEYTSRGHLIRDISFDSRIEYPLHSVQLPDDRWVVSHGMGNPLNRVCIVDMSGRITQSYGESRGSDVGQLYYFRNLAVDKYGNVLIADQFNDRVVLLNPSLTHLGYITLPGHHLDSLRVRSNRANLDSRAMLSYPD